VLALASQLHALDDGPVGSTWSSWTEVSAESRRSWIQVVLVVLQGAVQLDRIDRTLRMLSLAKSRLDADKDVERLGERVGQQHQARPELLGLFDKPEFRRFLFLGLQWRNDSGGYSFFERRFEQAAYMDSILFWSQPSYATAVTWIAIAGIDP